MPGRFNGQRSLVGYSPWGHKGLVMTEHSGVHCFTAVFLAVQSDSSPCVSVLVTRSCPTLCKPMDCSPPGSSVQGILQARILEWVKISFSRGVFLDLLHLQADYLLSEPPGKSFCIISCYYCKSSQTQLPEVVQRGLNLLD